MTPTPDLDGMGEDERRQFFKVMRRMHGVCLELYDPDDISTPLWAFDNRQIEGFEAARVDVSQAYGQVLLARIMVGPWEFWQDVYGQVHEDAQPGCRQFVVALP